MKIQKGSNLLDNDIQNIIALLEKEIMKKISENEKDEKLTTIGIKELKQGATKEVRCYFDLILEKILNYYLDKIKGLNIKEYFEETKQVYINDERNQVSEKFKKAERLIDDIIESCDPCEKYGEVYEDAEYIAHSLMKKKVNVNGLELSEPLKLEYIKSYSISSAILPKDIDDEIWYMILYIAIHYYVLKTIS